MQVSSTAGAAAAPAPPGAETAEEHAPHFVQHGKHLLHAQAPGGPEQQQQQRRRQHQQQQQLDRATAASASAGVLRQLRQQAPEPGPPPEGAPASSPAGQAPAPAPQGVREDEVLPAGAEPEGQDPTGQLGQRGRRWDPDPSQAQQLPAGRVLHRPAAGASLGSARCPPPEAAGAAGALVPLHQSAVLVESGKRSGGGGKVSSFSFHSYKSSLPTLHVHNCNTNFLYCIYSSFMLLLEHEYFSKKARDFLEVWPKTFALLLG